MTQNELQTLLDKWQQRLGLSDWTIDIAMRDAIDMDRNQAQARIQTHVQNATIRILNIEDRQPSNPADHSQELDLLHELIHIRLWSIEPMDLEGVAHTCKEQAIEWVAKALLAAEAQGSLNRCGQAKPKAQLKGEVIDDARKI